MTTNNILRSQITETIASNLKTTDKIPWRKPWANDPKSGMPCSASRGKKYTGVNTILLFLHAFEHDFTSKFYGTFKFWKSKGCQVQQRPKNVKKGEWGCRIIFYHEREIEVETKAGQSEKRTIPTIRSYTVFNADQVEGEFAESLQCTGEFSETDPDYAKADTLIEALNAEINYGGSKAFYAPPSPKGSHPNHSSGHSIQCPYPSQFDHQIDYYSTLLHELAHWSEVQLGWEGSYEMGELVAEMASCFLLTELGLPQSDDLSNHTAYLQSWLKAMGNDPKFIFQASTQASKVCDFLLSHLTSKSVSIETIEAS